MSIRTRFNPLGTIGRKGLPAGYIELEYLESTGTQRITVPHTFVNHSKFAAKLDMQAVSNDFYGLMGFSGFSGQWFRVDRNRFEIGATVYTTSVNPFIRGKITQQIVRTGNTYTQNFQAGQESVSRQLVLNEPPQSYGLFGVAVPYTGYRFGSIRLFSAEIRVDDVLKQRLIPALDPTGRPCMFDLVQRQPFYNEGTGEFKCGYKLPAGYTQLSALKCNSIGSNERGSVVSWIDTFDATYKFVMRLQYFETRQYQRNGNYEPENTVQFGMNSATSQFAFNTQPPIGNRAYLLSDLNYHEVGLDIRQGEFTLDGTVIKTFTPVQHTWTTPFLLGATAESTRDPWFIVTYCAEFLYVCEAYKGGKLFSCLVPCSDKNGRPCMYDVARRIGLYNIGTHEFIPVP